MSFGTKITPFVDNPSVASGATELITITGGTSIETTVINWTDNTIVWVYWNDLEEGYPLDGLTEVTTKAHITHLSLNNMGSGQGTIYTTVSAAVVPD